MIFNHLYKNIQLSNDLTIDPNWINDLFERGNIISLRKTRTNKGWMQ